MREVFNLASLKGVSGSKTNWRSGQAGGYKQTKLVAMVRHSFHPQTRQKESQNHSGPSYKQLGPLISNRKTNEVKGGPFCTNESLMMNWNVA